jgi:hypothetical protein
MVVKVMAKIVNRSFQRFMSFSKERQALYHFRERPSIQRRRLLRGLVAAAVPALS